MTHTPEPWVLIDEFGRPWIQGFAKASVANCCLTTMGGTTTERANARRIVACVNACAGATDKQVQAIADTGGIVALTDKWWTEIERHRQQCEELLAALIQADKAMLSGDAYAIADTSVITASAIAKAQGDKT